MITATIGTVFLVVVAWTSVVIVRRRLRYEWWHAVHFGNELVLQPVVDAYWKSLYLATLALLVAALRHRLRVTEVVAEGPGVSRSESRDRGCRRRRRVSSSSGASSRLRGYGALLILEDERVLSTPSFGCALR